MSRYQVASTILVLLLIEGAKKLTSEFMKEKLPTAIVSLKTDQWRIVEAIDSKNSHFDQAFTLEKSSPEES